MQYGVDVDRCMQLTVSDCNMDAGLNSDVEVGDWVYRKHQDSC